MITLNINANESKRISRYAKLCYSPSNICEQHLTKGLDRCHKCGKCGRKFDKNGLLLN